MGTLTQTLTQPVTPRDANGIARSTPKADRSAAKAAWATWVSNWKSYTYASGSDPGKFDHTGFTYSDEGGGGGTTTYIVTVASGTNQYGTGNKYYIQGLSGASPTLTLNEGQTYRFDQSDNSNSNHPLRFSTSSEGSQYSTNVTTSGIPGNSGSYVEIEITSNTPNKLYVICTNHFGMGGNLEINKN